MEAKTIAALALVVLYVIAMYKVITYDNELRREINQISDTICRFHKRSGYQVSLNVLEDWRAKNIFVGIVLTTLFFALEYCLVGFETSSLNIDENLLNILLWQQ
jgi:hypothetical protein